MNKNGFFSSDRTERALVAICLLGIALCLLPLLSDQIYEKIFGSQVEKSQSPAVGEISFAQNDVRRRSNASLGWEKISGQQKIHLGDRVYSGEKSQVQVKMNKGGQIDLGQSSYMEFVEIGRVNVPDLRAGNFRVSVNGTLKIAINGELSEIQGTHAQVQIVLSKNNKPQLRLLSGTAQFKNASQSRSLVQNEVIAANDPVKLTSSDQSEILPNRLEQISYTYELYDWYDWTNNRLILRDRGKEVFFFNVEQAWSQKGSVNKVYGQNSAQKNFLSILSSFEESASVAKSRFHRVSLGKNYVRLSKDAIDWKESEGFYVSADYLKSSPTVVKLPHHQWVILDQFIEIPIQVQSQSSHALLEISLSRAFLPENTEVLWLPEKKHRLRLSSSQKIYLRARGVEKNRKLTAYSKIQIIEVIKPSPVHIPRLAKQEFEIFEGEKLQLNWKNENAVDHEIKILNQKSQVLSVKRTEKSVYRLTAKTKGTYRIAITAKDKYGRISKNPAWVKVVVRSREEEVDRKVAAVSEVVQKLDLVPSYVNQKFSSSKVSFEGSAFTMYSQDQIRNGAQNPTALLLGLHWLNWSGSHGFEGIFKTKLADVNTVSGANVTPMQLEARYKYRVPWAWNPLSGMKKSEFSWILGYEYYRNTGQGLFSPGYDLVKGGFSLAFPMANRWDTGGEILYGQGFESSTKYEISGYLDYYLKQQLSFGLGYRVHLFNAGSSGASPMGVPYREGFGEGYSVLRWHY